MAIKVISYDTTITRKHDNGASYDKTEFIADTATDIATMNDASNGYLNYPAGSMVICLGNGKIYMLDGTNHEYLEFKSGGSSRSKADLSRSVENCSVSVTVSGSAVTDGINALAIGASATITATASEGYTMSTLTVNGESHTSGQAITVSGDVVIEAVATETPEPSGYTWDGQFNGTELDSGDWVIHPIGTVGEYLTKEEVVGATLKYKVNNVESTLVVANANISDNDVGYSVYTESTGGLFMSVPETWQYDELEIPRGLYFQYIGNRAPGWESYEGDEVYGCSLELAQ